MSNMELGWDDLPDEPYYADATRKKLAEHIEKQNRRRWRRLQNDYKWLQSEMLKLGLNPEDARFLL
jgi:hypothetical protein